MNDVSLRDFFDEKLHGVDIRLEHIETQLAELHADVRRSSWTWKLVAAISAAIGGLVGRLL